MAEGFSTWFPLAQQSVSTSLLDRLNGEFVFVLILIATIFTFATLISITTLAMKLFGHYREAKLSSDLIHDMLARQMTVEQIVVVLDSWSGRRTGRQLVKQLLDSQNGAPAKPPKAVKMPV